MEEKGTRQGAQDKSDTAQAAGDIRQGTDPIPAPKPSQAEGDRETVLEDLREKESEGKL